MSNMIISNLPVLVVLLPLAGGLFCPVISYFSRRAGRLTVIAFAGASFVLSVAQLLRITDVGKISYHFGGWEPPFGIEFSLDALSAVLLVLISGTGFVSTIYSLPFFRGKSRFRSFGYYSVLSLLICGLLGMTSTGDVFNLYVFLEITSLSGYALIAMGGDKGVLSSFRYLMIGTIGASFYLLGIAFIYGETGTLNMYDMSGLVGPVLSSGTTMVAMAFFVVGFGIKMALFPLHGWQPAAYTNAHPGAAPLIAGVMGKVPAYAMLRFFFYVFNANTQYVERFLVVVGIMSALGMIYGSLKAIRQTDFRSMLAYSSIAQIGYVGLGIAITGYYGLMGAVIHIIGHSMMKSCLFFCSGAIRYRYGETAMERFGQIYRKMPLTCAAIVIAALSMVGVPPLAGFFSKWYLALGAANMGDYIFILVLVISSLLNAVYFFRLFENMFMNKNVADGSKGIGAYLAVKAEKKAERDGVPFKETAATKEGYKGRLEIPPAMLFAVIVSALGIILAGLFNAQLVEILGPAIREVV